jgi:hypothetical protein
METTKFITYRFVCFSSFNIQPEECSTAVVSVGEMANEGMDVFCNSVFWVSHNDISILVCVYKMLNEVCMVAKLKARI